MKVILNMQKGFATILVILGIALVLSIAGGAYYLLSSGRATQTSVDTPEETPNVRTMYSDAPSPTEFNVPKCEDTVKPSIDSGGISPQEAALNQPLQPAKVEAQIVGGVVRVCWLGTRAGITEYEISRKNINSDKWQKIGSVQPVNDNRGDHEFVDSNISSGDNFIYGVNVVGRYNNKSPVTESKPVSIP